MPIVCITGSPGRRGESLVFLSLSPHAICNVTHRSSCALSGEARRQAKRVDPVTECGTHRRRFHVTQELFVKIAEHTFAAGAPADDGREQSLGQARRTRLRDS